MTRWSSRDTAVMKALHAMNASIPEIARHLGREPSVVRRHAQREGLRFESVFHGWTADDDETIRINFPMWPAFLVAHLIGCSESALFQRARKLGVEKHPDHWRNPMAYLWNASEHPNTVAARFKKGLVPANKGVRRPGWAPGRMAETQFKKGQMHGAAQHNYVPIGTEKVDKKRNVLMRKVTDDPTIFPVKRWRPVHVLVWEAAHGPVPEGRICVFKPGRKTFVADEITADKLEVITLAENMRRNTIHNWPADIKKAMYDRISLLRSIKRHEKRGTRDAQL
jgi:hypothetical protein